MGVDRGSSRTNVYPIAADRYRVKMSSIGFLGGPLPNRNSLHRRFMAFFAGMVEHTEPNRIQLGMQHFGAVIDIQTFGNFLGFHPHLHVFISDGSLNCTDQCNRNA